MPNQTRIVRPGGETYVITEDGKQLKIPAGWVLIRPGDATLTKRLKAAGPCWTVQQRKGRRIQTLGVWVPAERVGKIHSELEAERATPQYAKRRAAGVLRRKKEQTVYVEDFRGAVLTFLQFPVEHTELAGKLADAVTQHATPVGSGTVARTERIPIERRAEAAVIAWMRHNTTNYDHTRVPRIAGARRQIRGEKSDEARRLLKEYRRGGPSNLLKCPLHSALSGDRIQEQPLSDS